MAFVGKIVLHEIKSIKLIYLLKRFQFDCKNWMPSQESTKKMSTWRFTFNNISLYCLAQIL